MSRAQMLGKYTGLMQNLAKIRFAKNLGIYLLVR